MKKKFFKKSISIFFAGSLALMSISFSAASKVKINKTKKNSTAGSTFTLKISNANKKVKWSSNNKKVAKIKSISGVFNSTAKIKSLKKGNATITAKVGKKTFKCKVTVKKKMSGGKGKTVYIADTGTKYHTSSCRFVSQSKTAVKISWANANGYTACKVCH